MRKLRSPGDWSVFVGILSAILAILACSNGVSPTNPDLQPPTTNMGIKLNDFMEWIGLFPADSIPPPWITFPPTMIHIVQSDFPVRGWAVNRGDRPWPNHPDRSPEVRLYQVLATGDPSNIEPLRFLDSVEVTEMREWAIDNVPLSDDPLYLAARVVVGEQVSGFSNLIIVTQTEPYELVIESPANNSEIDADKVTLSGRGHHTLTLKLIVNGEEKPIEVKIGDDRTWKIPGIELELGKNQLQVSTNYADQYDNQVAEITLERLPPVRLTWPHGSGQGENYKPDFDKGYISAWYGPNDYHFTEGHGTHTGIDIGGNKGEPVNAVAPGKVINVSTDKCGSHYVTITDEEYDWTTAYIHLDDTPSKNEDGKSHNDYVTEGDTVEVGERIGTVGKSGYPICATAEHLHLELKNPDGESQNINPRKTNEDYYKGELVDLYNWWGEVNYWIFDWGQEDIALHPDYKKLLEANKDDKDDDYNNMCWDDLEKYTNIKDLGFRVRLNGLGFRAIYCGRDRDKCPCQQISE